MAWIDRIDGNIGGRVNGIYDSSQPKNGLTPQEMDDIIAKNKPKVTVSQGGGGGVSAPAYDPMETYREFYAQQQAELARREAERKAALQNQYNVALEQAGQSKDLGLKDSYLSYMKGIKNQKQMAAVTGGGGEIESLKNKSQLGYEENRSGINRDYSNNAKQLLAQLQSEQMANSDAFSEKMSAVGNDFYKTMLANQSVYAKAANSGGGSTGKTIKSISQGGKTYSIDDWIREQELKGKTREQIYAEAQRNGIVL